MPHQNERRDERDVVIVGAGPTGLMLAAELALGGVDVLLVERRATQEVAGSRAGGLHIRTLELLDQRGVVERFLAQGTLHHAAPFANGTLDLSDAPSRHNYFLGLFQERIEHTLAAWVASLGVRTLHGREVSAFTQHEAHVEVQLSDGEAVRARYLVGCDGGRSSIRKAADIAFPGWDASTSYLIAECETRDEPSWGIRRGERGIAAIGKLGDGGRVRMVLNEGELRQGEQPTMQDLRDALVAAYGTDFGVHGATWISRFTDMTRQAASYRAGRVFVAGDAAHVHSPAGGQGLNLGVQDAVNLGWKLALAIHGHADDALLDSYHAERHPVGARVLRTTMALSALERGDARSTALRDTMAEMLRVDEARRHYVAMISGLDLRYPLGEGHALLGRRMPDLELACAEGKVRLYTLLHEAKGLLLDFGCAADVAAWSTRVRHVRAHHDGELAGRGVLVRPDGHVAWVGDAPSDLRAALTRWFGPGI